MCQISRDAFRWPPVYDNPSYSITVRWISLNFNDPSYGMLRRMSFDRWSLSPALPVSPFLISSFAIFVFRRSALSRLLSYIFISRTTLAPSFHKFTSANFVSFNPVYHLAPLPLVVLSPLAKFFSSLRGLVASSFYREVRSLYLRPIFCRSLALSSLRRSRFSFFKEHSLLFGFQLPVSLITLHFTWLLAPSFPVLSPPSNFATSSSFLRHSRPPFLFITVYAVSYFSLYISSRMRASLNCMFSSTSRVFLSAHGPRVFFFLSSLHTGKLVAAHASSPRLQKTCFAVDLPLPYRSFSVNRASKC